MGVSVWRWGLRLEVCSLMGLDWKIGQWLALDWRIGIGWEDGLQIGIGLTMNWQIDLYLISFELAYCLRINRLIWDWQIGEDWLSGLASEWRLTGNALSPVETLRSVPRSKLVPLSVTGLFTWIGMHWPRIDMGLEVDWKCVRWGRVGCCLRWPCGSWFADRLIGGLAVHWWRDIEFTMKWLVGQILANWSKIDIGFWGRHLCDRLGDTWQYIDRLTMDWQLGGTRIIE